MEQSACCAHCVKGALLLLLFQLSHTLEERFTTRARGNLERLFADLPRKATVVEVDPLSGAPQLHGRIRPQPAAGVRVGQHVLVNPGENVRAGTAWVNCACC